jgi:hypothetical protein
MENILLHEKAWSYKLYKNGSEYVLSVPCGSSTRHFHPAGPKRPSLTPHFPKLA